jgi:hypothetical protein
LAKHTATTCPREDVIERKQTKEEEEEEEEEENVNTEEE